MVTELGAYRKELVSFMIFCPREMLLRLGELRPRITQWRAFCRARRHSAWCAVLGCIPQVTTYYY